MDNVDVEGGDENRMIGNPKRTVQKVSGRTDNSNTSKVTVLESSKADGNAPAEIVGKGNPKKNMVRN